MKIASTSIQCPKLGKEKVPKNWKRKGGRGGQWEPKGPLPFSLGLEWGIFQQQNRMKCKIYFEKGRYAIWIQRVTFEIRDVKSNLNSTDANLAQKNIYYVIISFATKQCKFPIKLKGSEAQDKYQICRFLLKTLQIITWVM